MRNETCGCEPVWNDTLYGRDNATTRTVWRRDQINAELQRGYRLSFTLRHDKSSWDMLVRAPRWRGQCDDAFYAQAHGMAIEAIEFSPWTADGPRDLTSCRYTAQYKPAFAGLHHVRVWLMYTNGSGHLSPTAFAPALLPYRPRLVEVAGVAKNLRHTPFSGNFFANLSLFIDDVDVIMGAVLLQLPGSPLPLNVSSALLHHARPGDHHRPCKRGQFDSPGAWVDIKGCRQDADCIGQLAPTLTGGEASTEYLERASRVWKPKHCRLVQFPDAHAFAGALAAVKPPSSGGLPAPPITRREHHKAALPWRVLLAGDSLQREEYCALRHFLLRPSHFASLDAAECFNASAFLTQTPHLLVQYVPVDGFYDSYFGWQDLPNRTETMVNKVLAAVAETAPHVLIWQDGAHSLGKNSLGDFARTLGATARLLRARYNGSLIWRCVSYVHSLGPLGTARSRGSNDFYTTSWGGLQAPRVKAANELAIRVLKPFGMATYDTSVLHEARPERSRDKMHWGYYSRGYADPNGPPANCGRYCAGMWADSPSFTSKERGFPELPWAETQILANLLLDQFNTGRHAMPGAQRMRQTGNAEQSAIDSEWGGEKQ